MRELWIIVFCLLTGPLFGQFEFAKPVQAEQTCNCNCAERLSKLEARIAALEGVKAAPAPKKVVRIVSWVKCASCPKIKAWATPQLLKQGFAVENVMVERAEVGKIYPYFEFCNDTTCLTIMVPNVATPLTPQWLTGEMVSKGIK